MVKPTKFKKSENWGKGKVTPVQIAFIVDRYLSDNNYAQTRSTFRSEASHLIAKSPVQEAPKTLLSLGAMLDEYICLKEEKVMLDQEKCRLEQEKFRVQTLLRGMQDVMNVYNAAGNNLPPPPIISSMASKSPTMLPQMDLTIGSPAGYPVYKTPIMMSSNSPSNTQKDPNNFSTPIPNHPNSKRRESSKDVPPDAPVTAKRSRNQLAPNHLPVKGTDALPQSNTSAYNQENALQFSAVQSSSHDNVLTGSAVQGSSVAKCLFNQPCRSPPINSTGPKTPPRTTSSQTEKSVSPSEVSSTATSVNNITPQQIISTNCTVISSEAIRVSPAKQIAYYSIERNQRISSSSPIKTNLKRLGKREHVKGRLDFGGSDMPTVSEKQLVDGHLPSQSNKEVDSFDFDLPNLDGLGMDFSLSELLVDFDLGDEGIDYSCRPALGSPDSISGSPKKSGDANLVANQVLSEFSSTVTEFFSEKDMNIQGPDSITSVKSITKCIKILSPVKNQSPPNQENTSATN